MSAVIQESDVDLSTDVEAVLNYTRNTGVRPVNYTFDPPPGVPRYSGEVDARTVTIHDARRVTGLGLDVSGFELIRHRRSTIPKGLRTHLPDAASRSAHWSSGEGAGCRSDWIFQKCQMMSPPKNQRRRAVPLSKAAASGAR